MSADLAALAPKLDPIVRTLRLRARKKYDEGDE
jgi:hypothetical protein